MATMIFVRLAVPGIHNWDKSPKHRTYLAADHRHQFQIEASTAVDDPDREIEFHDLMWRLRQALDAHYAVTFDGWYVFKSSSCEHIAGMLARSLATLYQRPFTVKVSEDGEAGAMVTADSET